MNKVNVSLPTGHLLKEEFVSLMKAVNMASREGILAMG